jgi:hypothetical protein
MPDIVVRDRAQVDMDRGACIDRLLVAYKTDPRPLARALRIGDNAVMNVDEAEVALADVDLTACVQAPLLEAKQLRDACLASDIPVVLDRGGCCGQDGAGCGCAPKMQLLARAEDVPRVGRLLQDRWRDLALREGTITDQHPAVAQASDDNPPCPACGTVAPLAAGACLDCGLQLE